MRAVGGIAVSVKVKNLEFIIAAAVDSRQTAVLGDQNYFADGAARLELCDRHMRAALPGEVIQLPERERDLLMALGFAEGVDS